MNGSLIVPTISNTTAFYDIEYIRSTFDVPVEFAPLLNAAK